MIKAVKVTVYAVCTMFMLWLLLSWVDVIAHNAVEIPQFNKYNAFVLLTQQEEMKSSAEMVGSPLRLADGVVTHIDGNTLTIVTTEDGEEWLTEAIDGTEFTVNDKLTVEFNTLGDSNLYNDEIVNFW